MCDEDNVNSVISINQSGGITAHTVNINAATEPTLEAQTLFINQSRGTEYLSRISLAVESPYPPENLYVAVSASSIKSIDLVPQRTGTVSFGHCGDREGWSFMNLQSPHGLIYLNVVTEQPEQFDIEWEMT